MIRLRHRRKLGATFIASLSQVMRSLRSPLEPPSYLPSKFFNIRSRSIWLVRERIHPATRADFAALGLDKMAGIEFAIIVVQDWDWKGPTVILVRCEYSHLCPLEFSQFLDNGAQEVRRLPIS